MAQPLGVFVLLLSAACVAPDPAPTFLPAYEPFVPEDPSWSVTRPVLLVSDCQLFNLDTEALPERNLSSQSMVATAIRSPQLNLFSRDVLRWILDDGKASCEAVIHLGDAADLGCEGELREFIELMSASDRPWLMTPGNHDCFYFGNFHPARPDNWLAACRAAGMPLAKDLFVRLYVASLLQQEDSGFRLLADDLGLADERGLDLFELGRLLPLQHRFEAPDDAQGFLEGIAWNIDEEHPWRSFVLQRAKLDGTGERDLESVAILLDSCQYWLRPDMVPNAWNSYPLHLNVGMTGEMLADQLRIVREWLDELVPGREFALIMSHHPVKSYAAKSSSSLRWLWREHAAIAMFVTAHTHHGHFEHHFLDDDREAIELNVGSTTDWPMEWRTLQVFGRLEPEFEAYVHSKRHLLSDRLRNEPGYFLHGWEIMLGEADDYRAFRQGTDSIGAITDLYLGYHLRPPFLGPGKVRARKGSYTTEGRYKDTLLGTYRRLVTLFPTDVGEEGVLWPAACRTDAAVLARIEEAASLEVDGSDVGRAKAALDRKIEFLIELHAFERSRMCRDPESGEALDEERTRYKLSQAVWASRYGFTRGRKLQVEDELIRAGKNRRDGKS